MAGASIENRHFLLRRLHSLFGLLPVGGFLMFHLWENSQSRLGAAHYNEQVVGWLQSLNYLTLMELFVIALPLAFHAGYGIVILRSGRTDVTRYPYLHNHLYWLQRISGAGILAFLLLHLGWTRLLTLFDPTIKLHLYEHMQELLSNPLTLSVYVVGLALSVFHLSNGLWTMAISWGVTTTPQAQRHSFWLFSALGIALFALGLHGIRGFLP